MGDKEGETIPSLNLIKIREDVYDKAVAGDGRARFTILHELLQEILSVKIPWKRQRSFMKLPAEAG